MFSFLFCYLNLEYFGSIIFIFTLTEKNVRQKKTVNYFIFDRNVKIKEPRNSQYLPINQTWYSLIRYV